MATILLLSIVICTMESPLNQWKLSESTLSFSFKWAYSKYGLHAKVTCTIGSLNKCNLQSSFNQF